MNETSPFSYACNRCLKCCMSREVEVNPYEVSRLAQAKSIGEEELLGRFVETASMTLKRGEDDGCIFLSAEGCTVYSDRPLSCRLYPLARKRSSDGTVAYAAIPPHSETLGIYGTQGTAGQFLIAQEIEHFTHFSDSYFDLLARLATRLAETASPAEKIRGFLTEHRTLQRRLLAIPRAAEFLKPFRSMNAVASLAGGDQKEGSDAVPTSDRFLKVLEQSVNDFLQNAG